ncbi:MAG: hypothetical protein M1827_006512 [Pycnora praestabilis]|nr:MAG: hypothetical protein M1827_006512 [Pycnora praestabilis]
MAVKNAEPVQRAVPESGPLFAQVVFSVIKSMTLSEDFARELTRSLEDHGAVCSPFGSKSDKVISGCVTHIISSTSDFPQYDAAGEALIPVVKPDWITTSLSKNRLANPRQYSPDPRLFFSGVTVCCADLPTGDKDAIIGGVLAMGGLYSGHLTKMVTHLVALTEDNEKCQIALAKLGRVKILLPHWFDDCLKLGKRIDERPYLLSDPEILRKRPEDPLRVLENKDLHGASSPRAGALPTPKGFLTPQHRNLKVFRDKKIMLCRDLDIGDRLRGTIEDLITDGGGTVTGSMHKADILVCQYREGKDYQIASRSGKDVGNLPWLYHLITHNSWTSPLRRLLHYPIARGGLPGFKDYRVSISNYNGEARIYLENLVEAAGGEFTKTMKQDNTHLVTAHMVSEKCAAAKEWNINIVNHLWLEESYAKWQIQSLTNPRYTHFPSRTNLGEVVGQTQIDRHAVEQSFFPRGEDAESEEECRGAVETVHIKNTDIPSSRNGTTSKHQHPLSPKADIASTKGAHRNGATPKATVAQRLQEQNVSVKTPSTSRFIGEGKENDTPSTTSSRGAKERAVAKLQDLAPDIALYEKERKRVGGVIWGGRKGSIDQSDPDITRKRSMSRENESDLEGEESREAKRAKKSRPAPAMRLLLSSYQRWQGQMKREDEDRRRLRVMGILVVTDPASCTHLAAPTIVRTHKFICALANAPTIISTDFVDSCLSSDSLQSPEDFLLRDTEGEKRYDFNLKDALTRAKANKGRLLHGRTISCTQGIHGGFDTYKSIIEANGGTCLMYRARAGSVVSSKTAEIEGVEDREEHDRNIVYLLSGTAPDERRLWNKFRQMVHDTNRTPRIVKMEWMLDLAMSQELKWKDSYEYTEADMSRS